MSRLPPEIAEVVDQLQRRAEGLPSGKVHRRTFIETYRRTTEAVGLEIAAAGFEDPDWVGRWDVAFAELFLVAHDQDLDPPSPVPRPWRIAFAADPELPSIGHLLLGMNAHINYDLPQALLAVIDDDDFADPAVMARRRRDHERIDGVLAARIAAEDRAIGGARRLVDRLLTPVNRLSSRRFLRESRAKVWLNAEQLQQARLAGPAAYAQRLGELEVLTAAKIADLLRPGQVFIRLALSGFGVTLPPR